MMSDFELLITLQNELRATLKQRAKLTEKWVPRECSKAKIHRLRLQIQEVMLRIERACLGSYLYKKEAWHK